MDFQKAFDSVPYERLTAKLAACGITGKAENWIKSFLTNRHQRVIIENGKWDLANALSRIPQSSALRPTLFVSLINDHADIVYSSVQIFVGGTNIYRAANGIGNTILLQANLDLNKWYITNGN